MSSFPIKLTDTLQDTFCLACSPLTNELNDADDEELEGGYHDNYGNCFLILSWVMMIKMTSMR